MRRRHAVLIAALAVVVLAAGAYGWWRVDLRWRPRTLTRHAAEISALLDGAGWVSPGAAPGGRTLYLVGFRSCPDCIRFETEQFPAIQAAGVETRVVMYARARSSDAAERTGVAELWANRDWRTYQRWMAVIPAVWTAEGLVPADGNPQRTALVEKSRDLMTRLRPLLADNGVKLATPLLVWRDAKGALRGCACEKRETYRYVRRDLGV